MGSSVLPAGTRRRHATGCGSSSRSRVSPHIVDFSEYFVQLASNSFTGISIPVQAVLCLFSQRVITPLFYPPISLIESLGMDRVILVTNREPESTGFGATGYHQKRDRKSSGTNS